MFREILDKITKIIEKKVIKIMEMKYGEKEIREFDINKENFKNEIAKARTFGFDYELEYLKKNNLALGGSLENAIVVTANGVMNPYGLRYEDEFVRHKVLDLLGDIYLLNRPIIGKIIAKQTGHVENIALVKALKSMEIANDQA